MTFGSNDLWKTYLGVGNSHTADINDSDITDYILVDDRIILQSITLEAQKYTGVYTKRMPFFE